MGCNQPHALCVPFAAQGHITPMIHLARLLHSRGFHITVVNSDYNHRLLASSGAIPTVEIPGFRLEAFSTGLASMFDAGMQNVVELTKAIAENRMLSPLKDVVLRLNDKGPPVSCIIFDPFMPSAQEIGKEFGIPDVAFWTMAGCSFMGFLHLDELLERGYPLFKDSSSSSANGYDIDALIDWMPAMPSIHLKHLPTFMGTIEIFDLMTQYFKQSIHTLPKASSIILNTFHELDHELIEAAARKFKLKECYTVGPLFALSDQIPSSELESIRSNLWKEESECMEWLEKQGDTSVIYVNFGSLATVSAEQLKELAWGLANSNYPFMWVIRPDLVIGGSAALDQEFLEETKERAVIASWCPQKQVLGHPSVAAFITHCGWNSTVETIHHGVPMLCWPFFADQHTNCKFACQVWGNGMEIGDGDDLKRDKVEGAIKELMEGEKGKKVRKSAEKWKEQARKATDVGGSSHSNLDRLVNALRLVKSI
ncbi:hypothetical protein ACLOJK_029332 [Asimina triloba]